MGKTQKLHPVSTWITKAEFAKLRRLAQRHDWTIAKVARKLLIPAIHAELKRG